MREFLRRMAKSTGFQVDGPVDTHLNRSKFVSVSRQIPAIYVSLIFNTAIVAWSFAGAAPPFLSTWFPLALCLACLGRLIFWWRGLGVELDDAMIARRLRGTTLLAGVLGIAFMTWASSLFPFGDPYRQSQLAFYMCVTVLGCCLCLTHLPITTLLLFATVVIPSTVFYATTGIAAFVCIAANMLTVSAAMGMVGYRHYRDFIDLVNTQRDLTERQAETQRLSDENSRLANIDALTGLPNRRSFFAELDALLDASRPREGRLALGVVDLDGFKPVNDVYGHAVGDELLCLVAARLRALCPDDVIFARLGGDEFGLILREPRDDDGLRTLGGLLTSALQDPFDLPRVRVRIAGSIGFATWPEAAATGQLLYERADYALYHAKENNRGAVVLYSREHERKIREASRVVQHLRSCDLERELSVACQPIIDTDAGRTIGFEALARWTSPDLGEVAPEVFIRLAERNNMVNELTCVLLRKALRAARDWPEHLRVSFNLSTFDMASPEAMQRIIGILKSSDFPTSRIDFEITETSVFVDFTQARKSIEALKALGARVSLDDFGCGYSSLAYVQQLPLDRIKIDRGFVANIETDRASRNIVKTIVDLCRNLDLACVVEGVETPSQLRALRELGCHLVQGYLYSRPMPVDNIPVWLLAETRASMEMADSADGAISPLRKTM